MPLIQPLPAEALYTHCDLSKFQFETTDELPDLRDAIGQPRAVEAVNFGIGIDSHGYNIFAMGPEGVEKDDLVKKHFESQAAQEPVPPDWVYVYNFDQPHKPVAISLPAGQGAAFHEEMERFGNELNTNLAAAFESDEYRSRRQVIEQEFHDRQEKALEAVQEHAREQHFTLIRTPGGLVFAPVKGEEVMGPEEFQNLPEEERKGMETALEGLQGELQQILQAIPSVQREARERMRALNREITTFAVGGLVEELKQKFAEFPAVLSFLDAAQEDIIENAGDLLNTNEESSGGEANNLLALLAARSQPDRQSMLRRYQVNLLVDNRELHGAPVVYEDNPTYQNLIGRVEHLAQMGALVTDFLLIKSGSLHRANGGYLILDAREALNQPYAWDSLKRALQADQIRIESLGQMLSVISTVSLEPEPIPLKVKIALLGDRTLYYLLAEYDPDFNQLFKVQADFEEQMKRSAETQEQYARLIATLAHENHLLPFDRSAVGRVIEQSARMVEDSERLTTQVRSIADLLRESSYWTKKNGREVVSAQDVQQAINAQVYRADRVREDVFETILRGTFLIDTTGSQVGQVNGLSVIQLGNFAFGRPSRITAKVRIGKGEVLDIEREVDLSGPIHSKGVLILSGFLGSRYAGETPLSLGASLVFEQSYAGVDGDSASSAELYALLSAISETPVKQSLAITGAISQHGQVQAIGGVNEKIEGFFDICKARGLTGEQGVLIPAANVKHLMLRADVVQAVAEGKFAIYPVENVDQGIELLSGLPAGEADENGKYPPDSINGRVQARLEKLAEIRKELDEESQAAENEPKEKARQEAQ